MKGNNNINDELVSGGEIQKLRIINKLVEIIDENRPVNETLLRICDTIPLAFPHHEWVHTRIVCNGDPFKSAGFKETLWSDTAVFRVSEKVSGTVEVFFDSRYVGLNDREFLHKDNRFIKNVATLVAGVFTRRQYEKLERDNTERVKELRGISQTTEIFKKSSNLNDALQAVCSFLPEAWQYPEHAAARIIYDNKIFVSREFSETSWVQTADFTTENNKKGCIQLFYLKEFPASDEGPFLSEERNLIDNLAALVSATATKEMLQQLLHENTERLKELKAINQTIKIIKQSKSIDEALEVICLTLPQAWQYPEQTVVRIFYDNKIFLSSGFVETPWMMKQPFSTPSGEEGLIEVYYTREYPLAHEGPFLKEELEMLANIADIIGETASRVSFNKLLAQNKERLKELKAINATSTLIAEGKPIDETLQDICDLLPKSWQYPKSTVARIVFDQHVYVSSGFKETQWAQKEYFTTIDNKNGCIEIFYLTAFPVVYEGPFLKEERNLLNNIAKLIAGFINNFKGRELMTSRSAKGLNLKNKSDEYRKSLSVAKRPLQSFFNQQVIDKYVYLDMMKYKVKDILFVATFYDAFILENEDSFFAKFLGEIYQYSLFSLPRITGVTSSEEAMELLRNSRFDLVILMVGIDYKTPLVLSKSIKEEYPTLPVYMLLNKKNYLKSYEQMVPATSSIDKLFIWNGNSQIFFAIVKSIEDTVNVENDTRIGLVRVILLIEDSAMYYSKYLQMLYTILFEQIQKLLPEVEKNELDKICKMRSRPKIIHVRNYEEATYYFNRYKDFILCLISDVEFDRNGQPDKQAGIKFINYAKSQIPDLPVILQSSDLQNARLAKKAGVHFIDKNSDKLSNELKSFLINNIFFGDFIFRNRKGEPIAVARSLREFETLMQKVPEETLLLHGEKNQFSLWLMSRGEIELARKNNPMKISDFQTIEDFRQYFLQSIKLYKDEKKKGKILYFDESSILDEHNIMSYSGGSFGGKGRGLAFINALIYNTEFPDISKRINIRTPITVIVGTNEFERFIERNHLNEKIHDPAINYAELRRHFIEAHLSARVMRKLEVFINQIHKPIAVRSSSISEDSISQPFAGVFDTYIIPNNQKTKKQRLEMLCNAIKLVYASVFSDDAKIYFQAIHHKIEEERMAVVLQELVGNQYDNYYYPHISGTAQSYNYYPVGNMQPNEGYATAALGLGFYVVGGSKAYRFSPRYPKVEFYSTKDLINNSQTNFLAVNLTKKNINLLLDGEQAALSSLEISVAEQHKTLHHIASTYNADNDRVEVGLANPGPRIINFADVLQYNYAPLSETISIMLSTISDALGGPAEIEYAVDLSPAENGLPSFYLLQIKPLVGEQLGADIDIKNITPHNTVLYTESSLGNGIDETVSDVIFVKNECFDKLKTMEMVREIEYLNSLMLNQEQKYVLIGPGRWGTRDRFLGIPVSWSQISNARVIVEISLENFPLDSSLGSHFFHNVTSMGIGYFSVQNRSNTDFVSWKMLGEQRVIHETEFFRQVRFEQPLLIQMDGKRKISAITQKSIVNE